MTKEYKPKQKRFSKLVAKLKRLREKSHFRFLNTFPELIEENRITNLQPACYKNPALTVDIIVFSRIKNTLKMLLVKRKYPPFQDKWAIPGGFVEHDEELEVAACRELEEETGIKNLRLEQIQTFGKLGRDPRGRTVSIVYQVFAEHDKVKVKAASDAKEAEWFDAKDLPELAFDHAEIIDFALKKLAVNKK